MAIRLAQQPVHAQPHVQALLGGLQMNVRSPRFDRLIDQSLHQSDDRSIAREVLEFVDFFVFQLSIGAVAGRRTCARI